MINPEKHEHAGTRTHAIHAQKRAICPPSYSHVTPRASGQCSRTDRKRSWRALGPVPAIAHATEKPHAKTKFTGGGEGRLHTRTAIKQTDRRTEPNGTNRTERNGTQPDRTERNGTEPNGTKWTRTERNGTKWTRTERNGAEASRTEPNGTEPNGTEPNRTEPNRTEPNRTEPNRTEPNRTEPNQTK